MKNPQVSEEKVLIEAGGFLLDYPVLAQIMTLMKCSAKPHAHTATIDIATKGKDLAFRTGPLCTIAAVLFLKIGTDQLSFQCKVQKGR